jgi:hypothetical protein
MSVTVSRPPQPTKTCPSPLKILPDGRPPPPPDSGTRAPPTPWRFRAIDRARISYGKGPHGLCGGGGRKGAERGQGKRPMIPQKLGDFAEREYTLFARTLSFARAAPFALGGRIPTDLRPSRKGARWVGVFQVLFAIGPSRGVPQIAGPSREPLGTRSGRPKILQRGYTPFPQNLRLSAKSMTSCHCLPFGPSSPPPSERAMWPLR